MCRWLIGFVVSRSRRTFAWARGPVWWFGAAAGAQTAIGAVELSQLATEICEVNGQVPSLTASQSHNAETVVAVAMKDALGDPGAIVGVMTAPSPESPLNNDVPTGC